MTNEFFNFFLGSFTSLFAVINPLGAIPVFLALTANDSSPHRIRQARRGSIFMVMILAFFLLAGNFVMVFFGISIESIRVAGGLIVLNSGFGLLAGKEKGNLSAATKEEALDSSDISLTPLALPLLSGPGSIATTISLASAQQAQDYIYMGLIFLAIVIIGVLAYISLSLSQRLLPLLGQSGLEAITRIMGFIAMTVGVQFILSGLESYIENNLAWSL